MLLNRDKIKSKGLIIDFVDSGYREAGYDLHIGTIIKGNGESVTDYELPPGGIVEVLSIETVLLPSNVCGYASIKTHLCDEGVLAIAIGIIDPGYHGQLSTTLLNFGKNAHFFTLTDIFLRLTFHEYEPINCVESVTISKAEYCKEKKRKVVERFSDSFLNIEHTALKASEQAFGKFTKRFLVWVPVGVIFLSIFTFLVILGSNFVFFKSIQPYGIPNSVVVDLSTELQQLQEQFQRLERSVGILSSASKQNEVDSQKLKQQVRNIRVIIQKLPSKLSNK